MWHQTSLFSQRQRPTLFAVNAGSIVDIMTAKNAEMLALKEAKVTDSSKQLGRASKEIVQEKATTLGRLLEREGCVSVSSVVSESTCDKLLAFINTENERQDSTCQHQKRGGSAILV